MLHDERKVDGGKTTGWQAVHDDLGLVYFRQRKKAHPHSELVGEERAKVYRQTHIPPAFEEWPVEETINESKS